jgi:hypothetical protein
VNGDHDFVLRNAPRQYVWQSSAEGRIWSELPESRIESERRLFRTHRFGSPINARFLRLNIQGATGEFPAIREIEFELAGQASMANRDWILVVNTTHDRTLPGHGREFIPLARSTPGRRNLRAQQISLEDFIESFVSIEPRPLCAFLSGNFKDWCQVDRAVWRGAEEILKHRSLPIWASCGGAQGLAILSEAGTAAPWDCPHCRDPLHPLLPIYTHIGHTYSKPCGDYSGCVFERGPHHVRLLSPDPVFKSLPEDVVVMESHCGQIEWAPAGWDLVATAGEGTRTRVQCLRLRDSLIYAAQFHIEMDGTPEVSRRIMENFLDQSLIARK